MAIGLQNYPNIIPPSSDYPSGKIKDDDGTNNGTPIDVQTNGDIQEFFAKLMREDNLTPSGLPDNEYSGNQFFKAFIELATGKPWVYDSSLAAGVSIFSHSGSTINSYNIYYKELYDNVIFTFDLTATLSGAAPLQAFIPIPIDGKHLLAYGIGSCFLESNTTPVVAYNAQVMRKDNSNIVTVPDNRLYIKSSNFNVQNNIRIAGQFIYEKGTTGY